METPKHFGEIRRNGIAQDTAVLLFKELEKHGSELTFAERNIIYDKLVKLAITKPTRPKPGGMGRKKQKPRAASIEAPEFAGKL